MIDTSDQEIRQEYKRTLPKEAEPYMFQPGVSGNPGGRPKRKPLTEAYQALMNQVCPEDKDGRTYAQLIARALMKEAIKGKVQAAAELADRVEGRVNQSLDLNVQTDKLGEFLNAFSAGPVPAGETNVGLTDE